MSEAAPIENVYLFSYGTLQSLPVQMGTFGRPLQGHPDVLTNYALRPLTITDLAVVELSGAAVHTIACHTGDPADRIEGVVFRLTREELAAADRYEVDVYARELVRMESGREAFVYVGPPAA